MTYYFNNYIYYDLSQHSKKAQIKNKKSHQSRNVINSKLWDLGWLVYFRFCLLI